MQWDLIEQLPTMFLVAFFSHPNTLIDEGVCGEEENNKKHKNKNETPKQKTNNPPE